MKLFASCFLVLLFFSYTRATERTFTGSTPADAVVRNFLGIPLSDSIDFIRWKITIRDKNYSLTCNYGISKPNTNGFIDGGGKVELKGAIENGKKYFTFHNKKNVLRFVGLNTDLLHILDVDNNLLVGNGGWSYTLNSTAHLVKDDITVRAKQTAIKDSIGFEGRSPCGVPGIIPEGKLCYKLKWYIVFYGDAGKNEPGTCKVFGTPYRKEGGKWGTWRIISSADGRIRYQVSDEKGNPYLYLEKADENILLFTDAKGKLLTGNEDFSFTLNKRF